MSAPPTDVRAGNVLAVDLGLRCGFACFHSLPEGGHALAWYRSTHFGKARQMKAAIHGILREAEPLAMLAVEGDRNLALPWERAAEKRGVKFRQLTAEDWRRGMLLSREQRSGPDAKRAADRIARDIIRNAGLSSPHSLRHDAAEAVVMGAWVCANLGGA